MRIVNSDIDGDDAKSVAKTYLEEQYNSLKNEDMDFRNFNMSKVLAKNEIIYNGLSKTK